MRHFITIFTLLLMSCNTEKQNAEKFLAIALDDYISDIDSYLYDNNRESLSRIIRDFNNDGLPDVMISGYYKGGWGNAGGEWTLYYRTPTDSIEKCERQIFMYPDVVSYDSKNSQIILYHRMGCCEGSVVFLRISKCDIEIANSIDLKAETGEEISLKIDSIMQKLTGLERFVVENCVLENKTNIVWK